MSIGELGALGGEGGRERQRRGRVHSTQRMRREEKKGEERGSPGKFIFLYKINFFSTK